MITGGDKRGVCENHDRKSSPHHGDRIAYLVDLPLVPAAGDQMQDHLRVGRGLENRPLVLQFFPYRAEVCQVAVVGNGDIAPLVHDGKRLDVRLVVGGACGGVAVVADRAGSLQHVAQKPVLAVHIVDQPEVLVDMKAGLARAVVTVGCDDARTFLAPVLLGDESEV